MPTLGHTQEVVQDGYRPDQVPSILYWSETVLMLKTTGLSWTAFLALSLSRVAPPVPRHVIGLEAALWSYTQMELKGLSQWGNCWRLACGLGLCLLQGMQCMHKTWSPRKSVSVRVEGPCFHCLPFLCWTNPQVLWQSCTHVLTIGCCSGRPGQSGFRRWAW